MLAEKPTMTMAEKPERLAGEPEILAEEPTTTAEKPLTTAEKPERVADKPMLAEKPMVSSGQSVEVRLAHLRV